MTDEERQELERLRILVSSHKNLEAMSTVTKRITEALAYPINSFDELAKAVGGYAATVRMWDRDISLEEVASHVPPYYFPVTSEADLIAKMVYLEKNSRDSSDGGNGGSLPSPGPFSPGPTPSLFAPFPPSVSPPGPGFANPFRS